MAKNGAGTTNDGLIMGNFNATATNSNTTNANVYGATPSAWYGIPNTTMTAFQVGLIHSF